MQGDLFPEEVAMTGKHLGLRLCLATFLGLGGAAVALAGPLGGDSGRQACDCPRTCYSPLHYWVPELYKVRAWVCPSRLDQFAPGPAVQPTFEATRYPCRALPYRISSPYADPAGYYGGPIMPPAANGIGNQPPSR